MVSIYNHKHINMLQNKNKKARIPTISLNNGVMDLIGEGSSTSFEMNEHTMYRSCEFGLVGAEQADESHYDSRYFEVKQDESEPDFEHDARISFPLHKIYGRDREMEMLKGIYKRLRNKMSQVVFISGYSGCGKTRLVKESAKKFLGKDVTLIEGKYDEIQTGEPYKAISEAFGSWLANLSGEMKLLARRVYRKLKDDVGQDACVLLEIIPNMSHIVTDDNESSGTMAHQNLTQARLQFVFHCFIKFLCADCSPIFMFIDDLQWADSASIELLLSILSESSIENLLFVGCFRSNEVNEDHAITTLINKIEMEREIELINLPEIAKLDLGRFIADTLNMKVQEVIPLTEAIHARTLGNIFFTMQALEQLFRRNALYYDMIVFVWKWNLSEDKLRSILSDDIVEMVKSKIKILPVVIQKILTVAAHTRSTFDVDTLAEILSTGEEQMLVLTKAELIRVLDIAVFEGLLSKGSPEEYSFSHDSICAAASEFISGDALEKLLVHIGTVLARRGESETVGKYWMLCTAVHYLNSTNSACNDSEARLRLAHLNLKTAKSAMGMGAFKNAAQHADKGIECLPADKWESHREICHELHAVGAEAFRLSGDVKRMELYCREVISAKNDCPLEEKFQIYHTLAVGLFYNAGRYAEAKEIVLGLLKELNCRFPSNPQVMSCELGLKLMKIIATKKKVALAQSSDMQLMTAPEKMESMKLLDILADICMLTSDALLLPLVLFRAIEYTTNYGVSIYSARLVAYATVIFSGALNDIRGSAIYTDYMFQLMDKVNHRYTQATAIVRCYALSVHLTNPVKECIGPLHNAHDMCTSIGEIDNAFWAMNVALFFSFQAGEALKSHESEFSSHVSVMEEKGNQVITEFTKMFWRLVLRLMGKSRDHVKLLGTEENQTQTKFYDDTFQAALRIETGYYGDYKQCAESVIEHGYSYRKSCAGCGFAVVDVFVSALSCYAMAKSTGKAKYRKMAKKLHDRVNSWTKQGNPNTRHWKALLDAEMAALQKKNKTANKNYRLSVDLATGGGYIHDAALAYERWGDFALVSLSDRKKAKLRLKDCLRLLKLWGALGKFQHVQERYSAVLSS